jgi:tetratricopeptide (TPR) repeat protein
MKRAKAHFKRGKVHQDAKDYDKAIEEYRAAYDLAPLPELLFNLGQVYRLSGNKREALWHYRRFLEAQPGGLGSDEAREHITRLSRQLEEDEEREDARRRRPEPTPAPKPETQAEPAPAGASPSGYVRREPVEPDDSAGRGLRIAGIATAITGGLVVVWGLAKGYEAKQAADTISEAKMWTDEQRDALIQGPEAERMAYILFGVGGALVATGGILYYFGHRARSEANARALRFEPVLTPRQAVMSVSGRF